MAATNPRCGARIDATKTGEADVTVSAGNTGALMAMSKFCLKSMAQVDRPAIACLWPTARGESIVLDVGATIGADARHLVDLARDGRGDGARRFRSRPADRGPAQCRRRCPCIVPMKAIERGGQRIFNGFLVITALRADC